MKQSIIIGLVFAFFGSSLLAQDEPIVLKNRYDSVSYAVGVSMKNGVDQFHMRLNYDMIVKGLMDAKDEKAVLETEQANAYIQRVIMAAREQKVKDTKELGAKFMEENARAEGIIQTQTGLQYRVINMGTGSYPEKDSKVKVDYTGYLLDGTKFDSSVDRGQPAVFNLQSVIPGWTEALQLMPVGSEFVVYIPSHLAYGDREMGGGDIPGGSTLMFEIKLLDIVE